MKVRAILNPRAGVAAHRMREAVERGRPAWKDYAVYLTREPGHATELAREAVAAGADVVLAVGGDGTVNEVARGLIGSPAALGIVPVGSGNGLARALRIPLQPEAALHALESGARRRMDIGSLNGRLFLNVAGVGFDAVVGQAFHERLTRHITLLSGLGLVIYGVSLATLRARVIREVVEKLPGIAAPEADFIAVEWFTEAGRFPYRVAMPRAALLDAEQIDAHHAVVEAFVLLDDFRPLRLAGKFGDRRVGRREEMVADRQRLAVMVLGAEVGRGHRLHVTAVAVGLGLLGVVEGGGAMARDTRQEERVVVVLAAEEVLVLVERARDVHLSLIHISEPTRPY